MAKTNNEVGTDYRSVIGEYARLAPKYERKWSFYVRATCRETLRRMPVISNGSILDVGCGTGALLHELARAFPECKLAGIDPSSEMLTIARRRLPANVELQHGWAENLPYASGNFDAVVSCNMFHYVPRPREAVKEMMRVLRPNGAFVVTDWCDDYILCRICDLYLRVFNAAHFRTYGVRECREFLENACVTNITIERYKVTWLWGMMTASARKRAADAEPYAA